MLDMMLSSVSSSSVVDEDKSRGVHVCQPTVPSEDSKSAQIYSTTSLGTFSAGALPRQVQRPKAGRKHEDRVGSGVHHPEIFMRVLLSTTEVACCNADCLDITKYSLRARRPLPGSVARRRKPYQSPANTRLQRDFIRLSHQKYNGRRHFTQHDTPRPKEWINHPQG